MPVYSYKTKSGNRWMFKISIEGVQFLRRGYKLKTDAIKAEAMFISMYDDKVIIPLFNDLVESYFEYASQSLKETTVYNLRHRINKHIVNRIPNKRVDKLKYSHFANWRKYIQNADLVSKNTMLSFLRRIFEFCKSFYGYDCSAVRLIPVFKDHTPKITDFKTEKFVSYDDFKKFVNFVDNDMNKILFILTYFTGLRLGEVLGLQTESFDSKTSTLLIYQSLTNKVGKGKSILQSPKSKSSVRKYYLPGFISKMLNDYTIKNKLKKKDFIFKISRTTLNRVIEKACSKSGISKFHFHQLRSTDSTLLHQLGVPIDDIAKYLGHTSSKVTTDHYLELSEVKKKEISELLQSNFSDDFR